MSDANVYEDSSSQGETIDSGVLNEKLNIESNDESNTSSNESVNNTVKNSNNNSGVSMFFLVVSLV